VVTTLSGEFGDHVPVNFLRYQRAQFMKTEIPTKTYLYNVTAEFLLPFVPYTCHFFEVEVVLRKNSTPFAIMPLSALRSTNMSIPHPFQCLQVVPATNSSQATEAILFGAAGCRIYSFDLYTGRFLSEWPCEVGNEGITENTAGEAGASERAENGEPLEKKRRVSSPAAKSESSSAEFVLERPKGRRRRRPGEPALPTVTKLAVTKDYQTLVAVTAEDKCLRVFKIGSQGKLYEESQRCEPFCLSKPHISEHQVLLSKY
jgi:hypothetical protein